MQCGFKDYADIPAFQLWFSIFPIFRLNRLVNLLIEFGARVEYVGMGYNFVISKNWLTRHNF